MRVLFDVNALIAIVDEEHVHHRVIHEWWAANRSAGWATCPLTENGLARVPSASRNEPAGCGLSSLMRLFVLTIVSV